MNKKFVTAILACMAALIGSLGYYTYTLHNYTEKLEALNEIKTQSINLSDSIINSQAEIMRSNRTTIEGLEELIAELDEDNSEYIKQLNELSKTLDEMLAQTYFDSSNVTKSSNATITHMRRALKGTALYDLASAYIEAEKTYGVNAYVLAAITGLESKWGTSDRAVNDNNLTGFAVYNNSAAGRKFNSKEECILETAKLLKENYLTPGGVSYNGLSVKDINTRYCFLEDESAPDYTWYKKVVSIAISLKNKANDF